jgi:hypothetical protein
VWWKDLRCARTALLLTGEAAEYRPAIVSALTIAAEYRSSAEY